jgi:hypothetical protein
MCSGEALQRERDAAARARREGGLERAALKQQLAEATAALMDMRRRTADVRRVRVEVTCSNQSRQSRFPPLNPKGNPLTRSRFYFCDTFLWHKFPGANVRVFG